MTEHNGTYLGISPTDESGAGYGEFEMVLSDDTISLRIATGLEVMTLLDSPRSDLIDLTAEEIKAEFEDGADSEGVIGWRYVISGLRILVFREDPEAPQAPRVIVRGLLGSEAFGDSPLFTPDQVAAGHFEAMLTEIEEHFEDPGIIPRLANDGKRGEKAPA